MFERDATSVTAGGFPRGDAEAALTSQDDAAGGVVGIGHKGLVFGPSSHDSEKLLVDFDTSRLWHLHPDEIMGWQEYDTLAASEGTVIAPTVLNGAKVSVLSADPQVMIIDGFLQR